MGWRRASTCRRPRPRACPHKRWRRQRTTSARGWQSFVASRAVQQHSGTWRCLYCLPGGASCCPYHPGSCSRCRLVLVLAALPGVHGWLVVVPALPWQACLQRPAAERSFHEVPSSDLEDHVSARPLLYFSVYLFLPVAFPAGAPASCSALLCRPPSQHARRRCWRSVLFHPHRTAPLDRRNPTDDTL